MRFRLYYVINALLLTACQNCRHIVPQTGMQVYIGTGQSLMVGFFNSLQMELANPHVQMFKNGKWQIAIEPTSELPLAATSPLTAFGKEMIRLNPSTPIGVINCAVGSTTLDEWLPGSCSNPNLPVCGLMEECMAKIQEAKALNPSIHIAGILHNEGQSLAHECAGNWSSLFPAYAAEWQSRLGDIPIVFAQLGALPEECGAGYLDNFRAQQAAIHGPNIFMIKTNDLPTTDGVHLTTEGQINQGQRFAQAISQVNPLTECSEPWFMRLIK